MARGRLAFKQADLTRALVRCLRRDSRYSASRSTAKAKSSHRHFVRQPVGIHAPKRLAIDEKITTAMTADVTESDRRKRLASTRGHNV
jgi:hypothetical protein